MRTVLKPAAQSPPNSWKIRGLVLAPRSLRWWPSLALTLAALFEYLDLDAGDPDRLDAILASAQRDSDEMRGHRTSGGAERSIGRWRR